MAQIKQYATNEEYVMKELLECYRAAEWQMTPDAIVPMGVMDGLIALINEKNRIIKEYQKADSFLITHGWKWDEVK